MLVRAKKDGLEVDGEKHPKGEKFEMTNSAAAMQAAKDGLVDIVADDEGEPVPMSKPKKK